MYAFLLLPPFQSKCRTWLLIGFYKKFHTLPPSSIFPLQASSPTPCPPAFFPSFLSCLTSPLQSSPILSSLYLLPFLSGAAFASFFSVSRLIKASFCFNKGKCVPKWGGGVGGWGITPAVKRVTFSPHYRILGLEMPLEIKHLRGSQTQLVGDDTLGTI